MFIMIASQPFESSSTLNELPLDSRQVTMVLKWISRELSDGRCSQRLVNQESARGKAKVLPIPVDLLTVKLECIAASGLYVSSVLQAEGTVFLFILAEHNGAWLEDHPEGIEGDDFVQDEVFSSFEIILQLGFHGTV